MQPDQKTILISKYKSVVLGQLQTCPSTIHWCLAMTKHQTGRCSNFCLAWVLWLGCCLPKIKYLAAWQDNNQMNCEKSIHTNKVAKKTNTNNKYSFFQLPFSMWLPRYHVNLFQQRVPFFHVNKINQLIKWNTVEPVVCTYSYISPWSSFTAATGTAGSITSVFIYRCSCFKVSLLKKDPHFALVQMVV